MYKLFIFIMGNQQCVGCTQPILQNKAYGDYQLLQENGHIYAVVQKKIESSLRNKNIIQIQLQQRKNIKQSHIVKMYKYEIQQQSYGYRILMYYQYVGKTLKQRYQQMKIKEFHFSEKQLFNIIYGVEYALQELYKSKIKHCCINLQTILCKNNFYKITDVSSTTYVTSYFLTLKGDKNQFLSEKLLQSLAHKSLEPIYEIKDDYFSLGLIILCIATKRSCQDYYNWRPNNNAFLKLKVIEESFKQLERNYSSKLVKKVRMLIFQGIDSFNDITCSTNLADSLQDLNESMSRVLKKIKGSYIVN